MDPVVSNPVIIIIIIIIIIIMMMMMIIIIIIRNNLVDRCGFLEISQGMGRDRLLKTKASLTVTYSPSSSQVAY